MAWNRPRDREQGTGNREQESGKFPFRGLVAGVIVVVGATVAAWWLRPSAEPQTSNLRPQTSSLIKEVKPAATNAAPAETPVKKAMKADDGLPPIPEGHDLRTPTPGLKTEAERKADFERRRELRLKNRPKPVFDNPLDQSVGMMLAADPTAAMPPVPTTQISAEQYAELVKHEIPINPDDPPEVASIKKQVYAAREEVFAALADGHTMSDIADIVRKDHNAKAELYQDANTQLNQILESGDEGLARDFVEKVNAAFEKSGVPLLSLPSDRRREQLRQMIEARKKGKNK